MNEAGEIVFQGQSGSANLVSTPTFRLKQNLVQALRGAPDVDFISGCFAGLLTEDDKARAVHLIQDIFPRARIQAYPDYAAAFWASEPGTDLCVIGGTGSLVCSWNGSRIVKSGGRGYILGDEGAAFQYGRDALLHYFRDRTSTSPSLAKQVLELFQCEDEPSIVSRLYRAPSPQAMIAKLAKGLANDAKAGAPYALESLEHNSDQLAQVVAAHAEAQVAKEKVKVCLAGGLWKQSSIFIDALARRLALHSGKKFTLDRIKNPPVYGAVRLAKEMAK